MSLSSINLSTLNSPCLVTAAGIALYGSAPLLQKFALEASLPVLAVARALSYSINIASVSVPGRMDGDASEMKEGPMSARKGTSLVTPRGWAFAIWGPIFLGELISVLAPFFSLHHHHTTGKNEWMVNMIRTTSGPFIRAQLFQSLWCAAFRPKYTGYARWISTGMLSMTALCLNEAHRTLTLSTTNEKSVTDTLIYSLPIALHFGWTTAASLVNLNGSVSHFSNTLSQKTRNIIGHLSVGLATCVGLFITIQRHAPIYGGVIAWALSAVADGMNQRLMGGVDKDGVEDVDVVEDVVSSSTTTTTTSPDKQSILVQRFLCKTGALMNIFAMAFVTELGVLSWNRQGLNNSGTSSSLSSF